MGGSLSRISALDIVLTASVVGLTLAIIKYAERKMGEHEGAVTPTATAPPYKIDSRPPPIVDKQMQSNISQLAGTNPKVGEWGGLDPTNLIYNQTPSESSSLFNRSVKYHPWTDSNNQEIRKKAFQTIYTSRLI